MTTNRSTGVRFASEDEHFVTYNFQNPKLRNKLRSLLESEEEARPRLLLLHGSEGIGRTYLLESTAYLASRAGYPVQVASLDLDGYEPDHGTLTAYINHQLDKHLNSSAKLWRTFVEEAKLDVQIKAPSIWWVSLFSIAIRFQPKVLDLIGGPKALRTSDRDPRENLALLIAALTSRQKLIVAVPDCQQASPAIQHWLLEELKRNPNLFVALSFSSAEQIAAFLDNQSGYDLHGLASVTFALDFLNRCSLREILNDRFEPNDFDDEVVDGLLTYSFGYPSKAAIKMHDLVQDKVIQYQDSRGWILDAGRRHTLGRQFQNIRDRFVEHLRHELKDEGERLDRILTFLHLAALCGSYVPVGLMLQFMKIPEDDKDAFIDDVDTFLVQDSLGPGLVDFGYTHTGLKGLLVYGFPNSVFRAAVVASEKRSSNRESAGNLSRFLRDHWQGSSRLRLVVLKSLSEFVSSEEKKLMESELEWIFGREDAVYLYRQVKLALDRQRISVEYVWGVLRQNDSLWPPYRLLALLNAIGRSRDGIAYDRALEYSNFKGMVLLHLGKYILAEWLIRRALTMCIGLYGPDDPRTGSITNNLGRVLKERGNHFGALKYYREAERIHRAAFGDDHTNVANVINNIGCVLHDQGSLSEALKRFREAERIHRAAFGHDHPKVATDLNNVGKVLKDRGDLVGALKCYHEAERIDRAAFGPDHYNVAIRLNNIGTLLSHQGNRAEAIRYCREAERIDRAVFGPNHPTVAIRIENIGGILKRDGNLTEAQKYFKEAFFIYLRNFGASAADTIFTAISVRICGGDPIAIAREVLGEEGAATLQAEMERRNT